MLNVSKSVATARRARRGTVVPAGAMYTAGYYSRSRRVNMLLTYIHVYRVDIALLGHTAVHCGPCREHPNIEAIQVSNACHSLKRTNPTVTHLELAFLQEPS